MIWLQLLLLIFFSLLLIKATDILTDSLQSLASLTGIGKLAITSLILAFATSIPELVVSVTAAFEGNSGLALGTIVGSNIANISLVVGGAALIGGSFSVIGEFLRMDIFSVFLAGVLPLMLLIDGRLSRVDGIILLLIYGLYNYGLLNAHRHSHNHRPTGLFAGVFKRKKISRLNRSLAWLFLGAALLMFAADMIVKLAVSIAGGLNVPVFLIGLFLVGVGATMPELFFEIEAVKKKQAGMVLGNLFGSVVVNSTLILGIAALINPIELAGGLNAYLLSAAVFGVMFLLFWWFVRTKKKLERWEGVVLAAAYLVFALMEWLRA
ncbi:MAG TPA: sodium:calcium antiporter [Patescibacteria group bacterium]|nr:sodium:calcium antiporter [Patescibacteria group bacterium]